MPAGNLPRLGMDTFAQHAYRIGDWRVEPSAGRMTRGAEAVQLDDRAMRLLVCLAEHAGQVVSIDELLDSVWTDVVVSQDSVYQAVTTLRRALGDQTRQPTYICTVPRRGYRLVAGVSRIVPRADDGESPGATGESPAATGEPTGAHAPTHLPAPADSRVTQAQTSRRWMALAFAAVLGVCALAFFVLPGHLLSGRHEQAAAGASPALSTSIAVMPFLDLTDQMDEEPFADGMTEQLIDMLARIPGVRVPARTSTFFYKDKQPAIADIAGALNVAYVLEGSVRKSGKTLRVTARLVRASDNFLVWSEAYDRQASDILVIQDDIAAEVRRALEASWTAGR